MKEVDNFYLQQEEPNKSCFLALRSIILKHDIQITETMKYMMPCFCYHKKIVCYLWKDKKTNEPYILFADGKLLLHPTLEIGGRARMKILRINPMKDLPIKTIEQLLQMAVALHKK